jgi:uncharacterized membrane protein YgcG
MYIIATSFDPDVALSMTSEALALGVSPERLSEKLGIPRDLDMVKMGVVNASFKRLVTEIIGLKHYVEIEAQLEEIKADKSVLRFLGAKFKEKQIAKLEEDLRKFGSLLEAPRWYYKEPRVQLLSVIRDYALDGSQQGDAAWIEVEEESLVFPIVNMFENADQSYRALCSKSSKATARSPLISKRAWRLIIRQRPRVDPRPALFGSGSGSSVGGRRGGGIRGRAGSSGGGRSRRGAS